MTLFKRIRNFWNYFRQNRMQSLAQRVEVEDYLRRAALDQVPLPTRDVCWTLANRLAIPREYWGAETSKPLPGDE